MTETPKTVGPSNRGTNLCEMVHVGEFALNGGGSIDPRKFPHEKFELYSIPSYDVLRPELLTGVEIGSAKKLVQPGDVLISRIVPHIQRVWVVGQRQGCRQIASSEWIVFRTNAANPRYLRHMLLSAAFHHQFLKTVSGVGGSLLRARPSEVAKIRIPLPEPSTQRLIVETLDLADSIRSKREQMLALTGDLFRSVFLQMFGDLAKNPYHWGIRNLDDLGEVKGGLQVTRERDTLPLRVPYLRVANVHRDRLDLTEIKNIGLTEKELERTKLRKGDVLIVEGHGNPDEIGRSAVWDGSIALCTHQNHLIRFRPNENEILPIYVSHFLNSGNGRLQLIGAARTTSGLNTISTSKVKEVEIPVPPIVKQHQYARIVEQLNNQVRSMNRSIQFASDLNRSFTQRAFRGKL